MSALGSKAEENRPSGSRLLLGVVRT